MVCRLGRNKTVQVAALLLATSAVAAAAETGIEEIVVVAQKREQSLQDIPFSISAVTGDDIRAAGIDDVFDMAAIVPSLVITQNAGPINTSFRIRRIGNEANIPNFEPAVGLFVDGAFRARSGVGVGDLIDIERIEVLRGPQTTLYGKNTTAGVINIITRQPTDEFEFRGEASIGSIEASESAHYSRFSASVSGALGERVRGRLTGSLADHGTTTVNLFNGDDTNETERYALRGQLSFDPGENLRLHLSAGIFRVPMSHTGDPEFFEGIVPELLNNAFGVPCPANDPNDRQICLSRAQDLKMDVEDVTLTVDYDIGDVALTSISGFSSYYAFRDGDVDQMNIQVLDFLDRQDNESFSQEVRLSSDGNERFTWLTGLYYYTSDFRRGDPTEPTFIIGPDGPYLELAPGIAFGQPGYSGFLDSRTDTDHFSVFAQSVWHFSNFDLTVGARWQSEEKDSSIANSADHQDPSVITLVLSPTSANASLTRDTDELTWTVSGQYYLDQDRMFYATVSSGFKSGGFNAGFGNTPVADREFRDETVLNYELGTKLTLLDRRLQLNGSVFSATYDDYQAASFISLQFLVNNAEKVSVSGLELDGIALLSDDLTATFGVSWVDAQYDEYTNGSCYPGRPPDSPSGVTCMLDGESLPFAPELKATFGLQYERETQSGSFYARGDLSWTDDYHTNTNLDPRHVQDAFSLINVRTGLRFGRWDVSLWIENLTDETWVMQDGISNLFDSDPAYQRWLTRPRTYGVTLRVGM